MKLSKAIFHTVMVSFQSFSLEKRHFNFVPMTGPYWECANDQKFLFPLWEFLEK